MTLNIIIFIISLPILLMAIALPSNEYEVQGIVGGVDCDASLVIIFFCIAAFSAYGFILARVFLSGYDKNKWVKIFLSVFSFIFILTIIPSAIDAIAEHNKHVDIEVCVNS